MLRAVTILFLVVSAMSLSAQSEVDDAYALELISRLEADPLHESHATDMRVVFSGWTRPMT